MPFIVLGHSVGEIAAAYVAGIFTVDEAISCAHSLGLAMLEMPGSKGAMLHTELQRKFLHTMEDSTHVFSCYFSSARATEVLTSQKKIAGCHAWIFWSPFWSVHHVFNVLDLYIFWVQNRHFQFSWIMKYNTSPLDSNMLSGVYAGVINVFFFLES